MSIMPLKFEVDIQSQSKVGVWKPKNPIWPPGGHFETDVAENQKATAYGHHQHAYEIWNWNSKANLTYAPETMLSTDRRTDGRTDGETDKVNPVYPPPTSLGGGIKSCFMLLLHNFLVISDVLSCLDTLYKLCLLGFLSINICTEYFVPSCSINIKPILFQKTSVPSVEFMMAWNSIRAKTIDWGTVLNYRHRVYKNRKNLHSWNF